MRSEPPTFFPLDGRTGWRTGRADGVSVDDLGALRLAARPDGPLALDAADGSLGGLALPRGFALGEDGTLYLLGPEIPWVKRFDAASRTFVELPEVGGEGAAARRFHQPAGLAVAGGRLYVADRGNRRVQAFALSSLALVQVWGPWDRRRRPVPPGDGDAWEPADVVGHGGRIYLLDRRWGRVYRHRPGSEALLPVVDEPAAAGRWSRLALDRQGRVYLLDAETGEGARLEIYGPDGRRVGEARDAGEVRSRFPEPALRLDAEGRFCLPAGLAHACDRRSPADPPAPGATLALCPPGTGLIFDRHGRPAAVDPAAPPGPPLYQAAGTWLSEPLDSEIYRCQWHRIELALAALPTGTRAVVSTYTAERELAPEDLRDDLWETFFTAVGPMQPPPEESADPRREEEFLILSRQGRYCWLRIELSADGWATPAVESLRVHFPRDSYLAYLPAVYSADEESRWFLERFLAIAQTEWDALEGRIAEIARHFDPDAVPEEFLEYLAGWLALELEGRWSGEQNRRLLAAAPELYPRRGTPDGLVRLLRIYLGNLTGLDLEGERCYPVIVEGFRERERLWLAAAGGARLDRPAPLWGPGFVGRLQLGVFDREGEVRLVSTGDPERDLFHEFAHRFRVFVPAAWVRTDEDESLLRRVLDTEKPAHTSYDLCLVEPALRVGIQSTVGVDTVIGPPPVVRLACRHRRGGPASRPPRHRLGHDTVLAGRPAAGGGPPLAPGVRVGIDTVLT